MRFRPYEQLPQWRKGWDERNSVVAALVVAYLHPLAAEECQTIQGRVVENRSSSCCCARGGFREAEPLLSTGSPLIKVSILWKLPPLTVHHSHLPAHVQQDAIAMVSAATTVTGSSNWMARGSFLAA